MKIKLIPILILVFLCLAQTSFAHKRAKYNIVIDTDAGIDDFRAITLFCASRDFNINCITTVDGVLDPQTGASYIQKLITTYHHEGISVGAGRCFKASKKYENHAKPFWQNLFNETQSISFTDAASLMGESIKNEKGRTIIIALGPLSNIAEMLNNFPKNCAKIEMILWYSDFDKEPVGYNYQQNKKAYEDIQKLKIPIKLISSENLKYSEDFKVNCEFIKSVYSNTLLKFSGAVNFSNLHIWDELIPLYLLYPTVFDEINVADYVKKVSLAQNTQPEILMTAILNSEKPDAGVVFNEIPTEGYMVMSDVQNFSSQIVEKHGYSEFKIVALSSEIHSHLGLYSILGAKTGLRIMEYLHAGLDEIEIVSYAGYNPPISCFNDGLQVGTGSTIGYGTISVDTSKGIFPSVLVKYNGRKILFTIKPEFVDMARSDIGKLIKMHGLESDMYWLKLRELSIKEYWLGISRFDLLDISEISQ